jgi:integrase
MASAGIRKRGNSYQVWWRLDDGSQGSKNFRRWEDARDYKNELLGDTAKGTWLDPRRGRVPFEEWADRWWTVWSSRSSLSPKTLQNTEARLRLHLKPYFGRYQVGAITASVVQRWQNHMEATRGYDLTVACRSILFRILKAAADEPIILSNPVEKVPAAKRPVDPALVFGEVKPRTLKPEEFGQLLARVTPGSREHLLCLMGTGMRAGEFCGLHMRRLNLAAKRIEILDTRFEAGKFGNGYKPRPKSDAGIRIVPLADTVLEAIRRQMPTEKDPTALVFTGPGGGFSRKAGERTAVSVSNLRRAYQKAADRANLKHLDLSGPHDLRHTFATWLEDGGIPARVIDEVMGHAPGRRHAAAGSAVGAGYRHTTTVMEDRVRAVIDERLAVALEVEVHVRF